MKKKPLLMLALGSLAIAALAKPTMRRADQLIRRRRGETLSGLPARMNEEDMQAVAQESSMVADGAQAHEAAAADAATPQPPAGRKDGDFAPPVGASA